MKSRSIRVMTIVHTHCLGVYQRPVAPLRERLCVLSQSNAFDDFSMRSRVPKKKVFSLSQSQSDSSQSLLLRAGNRKRGVKRTHVLHARHSISASQHTNTLTLTQTDTHTHTHTPRRSHAEKQKTEKKTSRDDITVFFARNGVDWQ